MLKYQFNLNTLKSDLKKIEVSSVEFSELHDEEMTDKMLCTCRYDVDNQLSDGDDVVFLGKHMVETSPFPTDYDVNIRGEVFKVNDSSSLFTVLVDKYNEIDLVSLRRSRFDEDRDYLYFYSKDFHLFNSYSDVINLTVRINGTYSFDSGDTYETDKFVVIEGFEWMTPNVLRVCVDNIELWDVLSKILFKEDSAEANLERLTVFRENILFDKNLVYDIYQNKALTTICVGLTQNPDVNLLQNEILGEYFVEEEIEKSINPIVEMEKCIFHPAIIESGANLNKIDGEYKNVYEIEFNLHFRPHKGEEWTVDDNDYWNGVETKNGKPVFIDDFFSFNDKDRQSDLLGYLDFNNGDIKFQKNKLKKSFLRLSFYDSDKPYKQNLLSYATVFHDCGELFNKYVRHIDETVFSQVIYGDDEVSYEDTLDELTGLRVNREPMSEISSQGDDIAEEYRLSSRFVIKDRNNSRRSSEGFHIYLWKDSTDGVIPQDLYLKVEYNHAGYGRTIPFMMPYDDDGGIKSFDDILSDWSEDGYGIKKYMRYSYIHFKYCFDKKTKKGIYYLDPDQYGGDVRKHEDDNKIVINLYEAKISNK